MPIKYLRAVVPVRKILREAKGRIVTPKNLDSIRKWAINAEPLSTFKVKNDGTEYDHKIQLKTVNGLRVARVGDVVARVSKTEWVVIKDEDYAKFVKI